MNPSSYIQVGVLAFLASAIFTWLVRKAMRRVGVMDVPTGDRKAHERPVAYEGGVAIYLALVLALAFAAWLVPSFYFDRMQIYAIIAGSALTVAIGSADDILDLSPVVKLLAQISIGFFMYAAGFRIDRITNPLGGFIVVPEWIGLLGTVVWYVLLMNGINMIDGLDGLAAGIVCITAVPLFAVALDLNQPLGATVALILFAVCAGFLPFNFSPATIFMGDAGSLLLGFLLATLTLLSSSKAPALLALLIPVLAVGLPLFETAFAFVRRAAKGQHPFRGDRRHLHHRFLLLGFTERRTVLIFYYITAYFGVIAYVLQKLEPRATLPLIAVVAIGMIIVVENMRFLEKRWK